MNESEIKAQIKEYLTRGGHFVFNVFQSYSRGHKNIKGIPDLICCLKGGRFCAIEVKAEGGFASDAQVDFLKQVRDTGGLAMIVYSVEDVQEMIHREVRHGYIKRRAAPGR